MHLPGTLDLDQLNTVWCRQTDGTADKYYPRASSLGRPCQGITHLAR